MDVVKEAVHHLLDVVMAWSKIPEEKETPRQRKAYNQEIMSILEELKRLTGYED